MEKAWISVYIYNTISFEKIIKELIKPLISEIGYHKVEKFFFIRYWENGPHIRLRILPKENVDCNEIEHTIMIFSTIYFTENGVLSNDYSIDFNQYIQEEERYGGKDIMSLSESVFEGSSKTVIELIEKNYENWSHSVAISYAIQMHLILAKAILPEPEDARRFFTNIHTRWIYHSIKLIDNQVTEEEMKKVISFFEDSYVHQKEKILFLVESLYIKEEYKSHDWMVDWFNYCVDFRKDVEKLNASFKISEDANHYGENILWSVLDSHIHMTNNRLGVYLRDESFIAFLIFKSFENKHI